MAPPADSTTASQPSSDSTTIPTPISLTSTTPSLPPATQQALIAHLRATGSISELSTLLSDSLARSGWTDRVRALSLELLRNGSCDTFPELLTEVLRRAKIPKGGKTTGSATNGAAAGSAVNGAGAIALSKEWSGGPDGLPDVRVPEATVEIGVEYLKDKIKDVVEVVDDDDD